MSDNVDNAGSVLHAYTTYNPEVEYQGNGAVTPRGQALLTHLFSNTSDYKFDNGFEKAIGELDNQFPWEHSSVTKYAAIILKHLALGDEIVPGKTDEVFNQLMRFIATECVRDVDVENDGASICEEVRKALFEYWEYKEYLKASMGIDAPFIDFQNCLRQEIGKDTLIH